MGQPETTKVTRVATPAFDALGLLVAALFGGILAYSYVAGRRGFPLTLLFAAPFVIAVVYERSTRVHELSVGDGGLTVRRAIGAKHVAWDDLGRLVLSGMDRVAVVTRGHAITLERRRYTGDFDGVVRVLLEESYRRGIAVKTPATLTRSSAAQLAAWEQRLNVVPRARAVARKPKEP